MSNAPKNKILLLVTEGQTSNLLFHSFAGLPFDLKVFIEKPISKKIILKNRIRKIGFLKTAGQVLFLLFVYPFISSRKNRIQEILKKYNLKNHPIPTAVCKTFNSINDPAVVQEIIAFSPDLICVNGTRIISKKTLEQLTCPVVNLHIGITPKYRGIHGGYWAIFNKEPHLFGVTLHYVDSGIDTGKIITQTVVTYSRQDNFKTYPILQYAAGIQLLHQHLPAILSHSTTSPTPLTSESNLYYHPTLVNYLFGR